METTTERTHVAALGACMSDLNAHVFALATEGETGPGLDQRLADVLASLGSVRHRAVRIAAGRRAVSPDRPPEVRIDP